MYDLVLSEEFNVKGVCTRAHETSIAPSSEFVIGGKIPMYNGGFTLTTILDVTDRHAGRPVFPRLPVIKINFAGLSPVRAGDIISAKIPKYETWIIQERTVPLLGTSQALYKEDDKFYALLRSSDIEGGCNIGSGERLHINREFKPEERAIELSILDSNMRVLRVDRAIDYDRYQKK